jgi:hypothetical protein
MDSTKIAAATMPTMSAVRRAAVLRGSVSGIFGVAVIVASWGIIVPAPSFRREPGPGYRHARLRA